VRSENDCVGCMKKVSIIIPSYNCVSFIRDAVQSALAIRGDFESEVIIVDDASSDGTPDVVRSYGDRVRLIQTAVNGGAAKARNIGLKHATGDYVQFLDGDDIMLPDGLSARLSAYDKSGNDLTIYFSDLETLKEVQGRWVSEPIQHRGTDEIVSDLDLLRHPLLISQPLYPRHLLEAVGDFSEDLRRSQERELNLRLLYHGCLFKRVCGIVYAVRHHESPFRMGAAEYLLKHPYAQLFALLVMHERVRVYHGSGADISRQKACLAGVALLAARQASRAGQVEVARLYLRFAECLTPGLRGINVNAAYLMALKLVGLRCAERLADMMRECNWIKQWMSSRSADAGRRT